MGGSHDHDGKHSRVTPMTVVSANIATLDPKAERAAPRAGCAKDNEPKSSNACLMTRVWTSSPYRSIGPKQLDRDVHFQQIYSSASSKGTLGVALWFRRSRFKQFEITAFAVSPRILSMYMTSTTQCFRFVVTHSPHSGQAADEVAMDSFYTELMSVTSPEPPDERVLLMGDV